MATKTKTSYRCADCGWTTAKWVGRCGAPACGHWGTVAETAPEATKSVGLKSTMKAATVTRSAQRVGDIRTDRAKHSTTGIGELDRVLGGGYVAGGVILLAGEPGAGKALALDTPIPTPTGWTTMGEVEPGDMVLGADGKPTRVIAATEVMVGRTCHEVVFSDGSTIVADAEHQWLTNTRPERMRNREASVRTTAEIATSLRYGKETRINHSVGVAAPLELADADLPLPPYTLGAWLGDGTAEAAAITCDDPEILREIEAEGVLVSPLAAKMRYSLLLPRPEKAFPAEIACVICGSLFQPRNFGTVSCGAPTCNREVGVRGIKGLARSCTACGKALSRASESRGNCYACAMALTFTGRLKSLGVWGAKHIPVAYLRGSIAQRQALLAGLLDTDGWVEHNGTVVLQITDHRLALDAFELIASLGYKPQWNDAKRVKGRTEASSTVYRVGFSTRDQVFRLPRKNASLTRGYRSMNEVRFIQSAEVTSSVPVRCIQVDNEDRMYLAGRSMIPTHNSTLLLTAADLAAKSGRTVLIVSGEESAEQIKLRADRVGANATELFIASETDLSVILGHIEEVQPDLLIVDSVQTIASRDVEGRMGGVTQVMEVASVITRTAKDRGIPTVMVGQVTKADEIGGPRQLEHLVDTVIFLTGDKQTPLRLLRTVKNRFGSADEIGCFVHTSEGLEEVPDPSGLFLGDRENPVAGTCVTVVVEGKRPLVAEVQSLVATSHLPNPRRDASGLDKPRLAMTQAVVERHGKVRLHDKDVYCAAVGGMKVAEPSADLAIALAIASAAQDVALPIDLLALGEVALSGAVRPVHDIERRLVEAGRMGFKRALVPSGTGERIKGRSRKGAEAQAPSMAPQRVGGVTLIEVASVADAVAAMTAAAR